MSKIVGDLFVIAVEPDGECELCGAIAELRPYGPNGERICFTCGMKNAEVTARKFKEVISDTKGFITN